MARPEKQGITYFSFDVDFFSDIKVKKIMRACGPKSIPVLINLLCNIYRDKGYYIEWDDEIGFLVSDEVGANESIAEEVVNKCLQVGFFDKDIFEKYKLLTSKGIQERYLKATYQRKNNAINPDLLMIKDEKQGYSHEKHMNNSVNHAESTQSKVKKSKQKESKEKLNPKSKVDVSEQFSEYFKIFSDYTKGVKTQPRIDAMHAFADLHILQREEALYGAKNYIEWHKQSGEDVKYSKNAYVFLTDLLFTDFQEVPVVPAMVGKKTAKSTKGVPEWSSMNNEPKEVKPDW